jgi:hypothetical protein
MKAQKHRPKKRVRLNKSADSGKFKLNINRNDFLAPYDGDLIGKPPVHNWARILLRAKAVRFLRDPWVSGLGVLAVGGAITYLTSIASIGILLPWGIAAIALAAYFLKGHI